ncbi:MAG TPA: DUF421 domain-containing protein [Pseudobacteroides sp.]|uniref:DUF421 domain-containing protein n=1 Tax=Pseudobacteroides sp. TaxID=1968840 RepID=UPI002F922E04
MYQIITNAVTRAIVAYLLLLVVARLMGRKGLSQMTFFDFAVIITLGSVTANLAMGPNNTTANAAAVLLTLGALAIITGYLHIKSVWVRKLTNSEPVTAIENGRIIDKNLKKVRFTMNELTTLLREKNIFNYADVEFAIIENDGQLSVLPKSQKAPLTPSDMKIPTSYKGLTKDLIMDGKVLAENLKSVNLDESWLNTQLSSQGVSKVEQVFYAGLDSEGSLYISAKQPDAEEKHGQYGIE